MKTLTNRIALLAVGALVLGTSAFGQTAVMKAQIPFEFRAASSTLPAGAYFITEDGHHAYVKSVASKHSAILLPSQKEYRDSGTAAMLFRCGTTGCALTGIRTDSGTTRYNPGSGSKHDREVAVVITSSRSVKAD